MENEEYKELIGRMLSRMQDKENIERAYAHVHRLFLRDGQRKEK